MELAELQRLSAEDSEVVLARLQAIHEFLRLEKPSYRDAEAAAARIGMKRTNFLRIMARLKEYGPVAGLTPGRRIKQRPSFTRSGFDSRIEAILGELMAEDPSARLLWYAEDLEARLAKEAPSLTMPSLSTLRRRINALRTGLADGVGSKTLEKKGGRFGREFLIDYTAVDLTVRDRVDAETINQELLVAGFVVDMDTRIIVGAGMGRPGRYDDPTLGALADVDYFLEQTVIGSVEIQTYPDAVVWCPPKAMEHEALRAEEVGRLNGVLVDVRNDRPSNPGQLLLQLLGDRVGSLSLKPRMTTSRGSRSKLPTATSPGVINRQEAANRLADAVDDWNYALLCRREGRKTAATPELRRQRLQDWSRGPSRIISGQRLAGLINAAVDPFDKAERFAVHKLRRSTETGK